MNLLIEKTIYTIFLKALKCLLKALGPSWMDYRYISLLHSFYSNSKATFKIHNTTRKFPIQKEVRQGDSLLLRLFNTIQEYAFKKPDSDINVSALTGKY